MHKTVLLLHSCNCLSCFCSSHSELKLRNFVFLSASHFCVRVGQAIFVQCSAFSRFSSDTLESQGNSNPAQLHCLPYPSLPHTVRETLELERGKGRSPANAISHLWLFSGMMTTWASYCQIQWLQTNSPVISFLWEIFLLKILQLKFIAEYKLHFLSPLPFLPSDSTVSGGKMSFT